MNITYRARTAPMVWGVILTIIGVALTMSFVLPFIGFIMGMVGLVVLTAGIGLISTVAKSGRHPPDEGSL